MLHFIVRISRSVHFCIGFHKSASERQIFAFLFWRIFSTFILKLVAQSTLWPTKQPQVLLQERQLWVSRCLVSAIRLFSSKWYHRKTVVIKSDQQLPLALGNYKMMIHICEWWWWWWLKRSFVENGGQWLVYMYIYSYITLSTQNLCVVRHFFILLSDTLAGGWERHCKLLNKLMNNCLIGAEQPLR